MTYGNGSFWTDIDRPYHCYDLEPVTGESVYGDSTDINHTDESLDSIVFDPPFLTYIRQNREGNGNMIMAKRFSGYWRYEELELHYKKSLAEMYRVLTRKGIVIFKCQDIIHNHKMHSTHSNIINWSADMGYRLKDLFILTAKHRMPSPNRRGSQRHARIFHSYFLVLQKQ